MGDKIIAYHGTGVWHLIKKSGCMDPSPEDVSYGEEDGALASCGGTYLAKAPEDTVPYALRASNEYCSDATIVMVEIDTDLLIPDEDRIATPLRRFLDDTVGRSWIHKSAESLTTKIEALSNSDLRSLSYAFGDSVNDPDRVILRKGILAYALRSLEDGETDLKDTASAINELCKAYRDGIADEWSTQRAVSNSRATFRTFEAIGKAPGTRILGAATFIFKDKGLELADVHVDGEFPEDVIDLLVETAADYYDYEGVNINVTYQSRQGSSYAA